MGIRTSAVGDLQMLPRHTKSTPFLPPSDIIRFPTALALPHDDRRADGTKCCGAAAQRTKVELARTLKRPQMLRQGALTEAES
jgi:hypothetical protein